MYYSAALYLYETYYPYPKPKGKPTAEDIKRFTIWYTYLPVGRAVHLLFVLANPTFDPHEAFAEWPAFQQQEIAAYPEKKGSHK